VTDPDTQSVELGLKFRSMVAGSVTGIRFYKGPQNTGTHVGHLWAGTGTLLAKVTFSGETSSGWQQANFTSPVAITANTTYVVSYHASKGHYSDDTSYFSAAGVSNGPLQALRDGQDGSNGVYHYGSTAAYPTSGYLSSNYWVDVVFAPDASQPTQSSAAALAAAGVDRRQTDRTDHSAGTMAVTCSPRSVHPGQSFSCELRLINPSSNLDVRIDGSTTGLTLPALVRSREGQHIIQFMGSANANAEQGPATVSAQFGPQHAEDVLQVLPAAAPAISAPPTQYVQAGTEVSFKISADSVVPAVLSAIDVPAGATFDTASGRFNWSPMPRQHGSYDVKFAATTAAASTTLTVHLEVGSGAPMIDSTQQLMCSPGALGSLHGRWMGPVDPAAASAGHSVELDGTRVKVNGAFVPVLGVSQTQATFLCPSGAEGDPLQVVLETPFGATEPITGSMQVATPVLLSTADGSQGWISFSGTSALATVRDARTAGQPAQPGDLLSLRASGFDDNLPFLVKIGEVYAEILSSMPDPDTAGVRVIQVKLPPATAFGNSVPVQLEVTLPDGRRMTSNTVTIAAEPVQQ
jgi:uncharacterized protein (TIGR03437 family)